MPYVVHVHNGSAWANGCALSPLPDWIGISLVQRCCLLTHAYVIGAVFVTLAGCVIVVIWRARRTRLLTPPFGHVINVMLLLMFTARALFLLVDPYESRGLLNTQVVRVINGIALPCITSSFSMIQMALLTITKPPCTDACESRGYKYTLLMIFCTTHFVIVVTIEIIVSYNCELRRLTLINQCGFIIWSLILGIGFFYNYFQMAAFERETRKALKQFIAYNKARRKVLLGGDRREINLLRIDKPRIRTENESDLTDSEASDRSQPISSSDELFFCNGGTLHCDNNRKAYSHDICECSWYEKSPHTHETRCNSACHSVQSREEVPIRTSYANDDILVSESQPATALLSEGCCDVCHAYSNDGAFVGSNNRVMPSLEREVALSSVGDNIGCTSVVMTTLLRAVHDSGYMADTEHNSPIRATRGRHLAQVIADQVTAEASDSPLPAYRLPSSDGSLGLSRIRLGRVLGRILRMAYVTTLCCVLCGVLQTFATFGVFGVLSNQTIAALWPWLAMHTVLRISEIGMGGSMLMIAHVLCCRRNRCSRRKRTRRTQTKC